MEQSYFSSISTKHIFISGLLQQIQFGEIRVPAFQRNFVWGKELIRELFQSVYSGYPIGSIILWQTDDKSFIAKTGDGTPFPDVEMTYPTTFVVDGVQRLSSLYGVLIDYKTEELEKKFTLFFDLDNENFRYSRAMDPGASLVKLSDLFSSERFISVQKNIFEQQNGQWLFQRLMKVYNALQQYQIPVTTIHNSDVKKVVEIFGKINLQGKPLSKKDFKAANDWVDDFVKNDPEFG